MLLVLGSVPHGTTLLDAKEPIQLPDTFIDIITTCYYVKLRTLINILTWSAVINSTLQRGVQGASSSLLIFSCFTFPAQVQRCLQGPTWRRHSGSPRNSGTCLLAWHPLPWRPHLSLRRLWCPGKSALCRISHPRQINAHRLHATKSEVHCTAPWNLLDCLIAWYFASCISVIFHVFPKTIKNLYADAADVTIRPSLLLLLLLLFHLKDLKVSTSASCNATPLLVPPAFASKSSFLMVVPSCRRRVRGPDMTRHVVYCWLFIE